MSKAVEVKVFFNFRSPYCYLASKNLWRIFDDYHATLVWRPFGGWDGRSNPERAKIKVPLTRQDVGRWARRMGIPMNPPPLATDPTKAGAGSLLAERKGLLREYIIEVMRAEWADGQDIGRDEVLLKIGAAIGLSEKELVEAVASEANLKRLEANRKEADEMGIFGVPSFVIGEEKFWGNDRIDFVIDYLRELRLSKV